MNMVVEIVECFKLEME